MSSQGPARVELSREVESGWRTFQKNFDENKNVIVNRWLNMPVERRKALLASEWTLSASGRPERRLSEQGSEMPKGHRPDLMEVAPWRNDSNKYRKLLPVKKGLDENHLRWPDFNQKDLAERKETFLVCLSERAQEHPCQFASMDAYRENKYIAANEGLLDLIKSYFLSPGDVLVRMRSVEGEGDDYGTRYFPTNAEELLVLLNTLGNGVWAEEPAVHAMVNQRRIYQFLNSVVLKIKNDQSYRVPDEKDEKRWQPVDPNPNDSGTPKFLTNLNNYVDYLRDTMHYMPMNGNLLTLVMGICYRHTIAYGDQLKGLKSSPRMFWNYISDIREHSHHEVLYSVNSVDSRHRWATCNNSIRDPEMVGTYLIKALHDVIQGYDCWSHAFGVSRALSDELANDPSVLSDMSIAYLIYLFNILEHRSVLDDLSSMLACSKPLRKYFRNHSVDEKNPNMNIVGNSRLPRGNSEEASLVSLLKALRDKENFEAISLETDSWASEIVPLCDRKKNGETWMTNFATEKAKESRDAIGAFLAIKRIWDANSLRGLVPDPHKDRQWWDYIKPSDRLRAIDPNDIGLNAIVSKHMIPDPHLKFAYPEINADQKETKRREHAATRKASERNLAALWEDLQDFLVRKQALSAGALDELNDAIPFVTGDNGDDVFPPPPPETSPQDESNQPSTPPGPSGTGDPTTPTQLLGKLAVVTPTRPSPAKRTPEKKTKDDGVSKFAAPNRRKTPADSPPRRPPTERRRERQERLQRILAQQPAVVAPRPEAAPAQAAPRIELNARNYELLRLIMTTDGQGRPGTVPWSDILAIFRDIGFSINVQGGRNSRGQITVFTPSEALCQSQGINGILSRDRPHGSDLAFVLARDFFRGPHGFRRYGWDFSHFKLAGT